MDVAAGLEPVPIPFKALETCPIPEFNYTPVNVLSGGSELVDTFSDAEGCDCLACEVDQEHTCPWSALSSLSKI